MIVSIDKSNTSALLTFIFLVANDSWHLCISASQEGKLGTLREEVVTWIRAREVRKVERSVAEDAWNGTDSTQERSVVQPPKAADGVRIASTWAARNHFVIYGLRLGAGDVCCRDD